MNKSKKQNYFSKLSENARISIRFASDIATTLFDKEVTPLHLFLGILLNKESIGSKALTAMGVDTTQTLQKLAGTTLLAFDRAKFEKNTKDILLSKESKDVIRVAYSIASSSSHVYVGTEHILLAILRQTDLKITQELEDAGLTYKFFKENLSNFATYPIGILAKPELQDDMDGEESQLGLLGQDLVELARDGVFDPLVGREDELEQIINVLSRRRKNNPVIIGDPGVGKTAIIEGLAQLIAAGTVPNSLMNTRLISLDVSALLAGSKLRGDVEEKVLAIISEVAESKDVILFIDEIHNILGTNFPGGGMDIAAVLKPALVRDDFRVIGATTTVEFSRYFEEDNALVRRFQPIFIEEPSIEESIEIMHRVEPILEKHHNVNISEEAIEASVRLSDRYVSDRFLPDKAIDLMDEAAASRRLQLEVKYKDLADLMGEYQAALRGKEKAVFEGDMETAKKMQQRERAIQDQMDQVKKKRTRSKYTSKYKVDVDAIQETISKWTGIPVTTISTEETDILKKLNERLGTKVVGQEEAVNAVASAIKRARTGISASDRPWASLLFLGPTGVGKTELAKVLTELLFGDEDRLIQIDMSELMEMHSISKLIGSPPGYVGYREGGQLTEKIRKRPHSVILFDEIEKAHPDVLNILLQIMEYGHLTDGKGHKVDFKNTVVILTSNIGAEEIRKDKVLGFAANLEKNQRSDSEIEAAFESMRDDLEKELKDTLRPELLNRLDDIVIFRSLTRKDARMIVSLLVDELNGRLRSKKISLSLDKDVVNKIVEDGFSEEYGARNLRRVLQDKVESALADYLLDSRNGKSKKVNGEKAKRLSVVLKNGEIAIS
ncbi:MAG: ATP-dependent Clp protease ATP-binding subunit [Candidatus Dojkabacteria bacterium]|nr:MAG: ATP-dependent Clp protease ATP-binding subunit [Candidatus Dojkabacteria bacterium]